MNKSELISELSEETTYSKKDITRVIDSLTRIIGRTLKKGEKVAITGFGSFWLSNRPARKGINPFTGEETMFKAKPARNVVKVKPLKKLKDMVA